MKNIKIMSVIGGLALIISLIGGIFTLDSRYARSDDIVRVEKQTVQTLEQFSKNLDLRFYNQRYQSLIDQKFQIKLMIKRSPEDMDLKDDLRRIDREKELVKQKIDDLMK